MFLNVIYKSMRSDPAINRVKVLFIVVVAGVYA